jgi:serine/threonine protein kinase
MSSIPDLIAPPVPEGAMLFNRYRYLREIGRGGMGRVILAHDEILAIDVALKLVPEEVVQDTGGLRDLKREVLRGMALSHPHIVRVHSFEQDATHGAIVMEYVEGETLADAKARQPQGCFDHETLEPWLEQLCSVLDHAHREVKIAHRDLKPRNVLLARDGRGIKVADFGISCSLAETVHRLTTHVDPIGTPPYMSPQQAMGETPSHLDDIYSLGATLYDLLTGRPPFYRGNVVMQALQHHAPSIAERRRELGKQLPPLPQSWERVVAACLSKRPSDRPGSGEAILAALRETGRFPAVSLRSPLESAAPASRVGGVTDIAELAQEAKTHTWRASTENVRPVRPWSLRRTASFIFTAIAAGGFAAAALTGWRMWQQHPGAAPKMALTPPSPPAVIARPTPPPRPFDDFNHANGLQPAQGLDRPPSDFQRPPPPPPRRPR